MSSKWKEVSLDQALDINPSVKMQKGGAYPFVDMQTIEAGNKFVSPMQTREFKGSGSRFVDGDTLMARITPCLENGKISRYRSKDKTPAHGSTEFIVLRHRDKVTAPEFVYYLTISDQVKPFAIAQMTGSSGRQRVPVDAFKRLTVTLPPLKEQQAIAEILRTLDDKIELNRQRCETLEKTAATLFRSWFVDFDPVKAKMEGRTPEGMSADLLSLFPDRFEDSELGAIPRGWKIHSFDEIIELSYGKALKAENRNHGHVPVYGSNGIVGFHDEVLVKGPVVIVGRKGNPGTVTYSHEDCFPIDTTFYVEIKKSMVGNQFIYFALQRASLEQLAADSAVPGLNRNAAYTRKLVMPSNRKTLDSYNEITAAFFTKIASLQKQISTLTMTRDALLPKLISGELRVEDVEG